MVRVWQQCAPLPSLSHHVSHEKFAAAGRNASSLGCLGLACAVGAELYTAQEFEMRTVTIVQQSVVSLGCSEPVEPDM